MTQRSPYRFLAVRIWAGVLATCAALAGITAWTDWRDYERAVQDIRTAAATAAQALDQDASRLLSAVDMILSAAAARVDMHAAGASDANTRALLDGLMRRVPAVTDLRVLDGGTGTPLFVHGRRAAAEDAALLADMAAHPGEAFWVGAPLPSETGWHVSVARRIAARAGDAPLVAVADLSLAELQRFYASLDLGAQGAVTLIRTDGMLLVRDPYLPEQVGAALAGGELMRAAARAKAGFVESNTSPLDGVARTISFRRLPDAPLVVAAGIARHEALAPWRAGIRQDIVLVLAVSLVLVGLGFGLTRVLARHAGLEARAREAAGRLAAEEARYRLLAENTSELIVLADEDGRCAYVSPAVERLLGYGPEAFAAAPLRLVHPDDRPALRAVRRLGPEVSQVTVVCRARRRRGGLVWLEGVVRRVPAAPGGPTLLATFRDVSERQRQARDLEEARIAAERASQAKTDFLAAMSHEIRTPLNGVLGYADLLLDDPGLAAHQRRYAERIGSAGAALLTVVDDILDVSRIEAGAIDLAPAPFSPEGLVDNAVSIVRGMAERKGLALEVSLDPRLPAFATGDADRLRQILLNLLNNAVKFTRAGRVSLRVFPDPDGPPDALRFCVEDTGIGIDPAQHDRLFQRFGQLDPSIRREFGGSGLGLAICRSLVLMMGGEIGVESRLGEGARFWFSLPLPPAEAPVPARDAPGRVPAPPARILLVEDVAINRDLARLVLEAEGHAVDVAEDGAGAVRMVQARAYDLVLMDVQMPGMDGITATEIIRALPGPERAVPIVAMTANVLPAQVEAFRAAGMDGHVGKPFKRHELAAAIAAHRATGAAAAQPAAPVPETAPEVAPEVAHDREAFASLAGLLGPERLAAMLDRLADDLRLRFRGDEPGALARDAHAVVAAAGLLGFTALSDLCRSLEEACEAGRDVTALHADLDRAGAAVLERIAAVKAGSFPRPAAERGAAAALL
ncbi:ATP-binding protein [uncultured Methylobacterium sp.]|jgi:PAS domain S-box-containing protein|uniref:ATP-binding protein n=1 Tax=uncultured Methylobacterium sp. TaxID=157278 RepID=UPI0026067557|nr:ATP-binding protein [uncultured Methylobacterium sp.]